MPVRASLLTKPDLVVCQLQKRGEELLRQVDGAQMRGREDAGARRVAHCRADRFGDSRMAIPPLSATPCDWRRDQPIRPPDEDEDHEAQHEGIAERERGIGQKSLEQHL